MALFSRLLLFLTVVTIIVAVCGSHPEKVDAGSCSTDVGSNLAGNWDESNLKFLREQANCEGKIAVNVIFTPGDLVDIDSNTGKPRIYTIMKLLEKYNLDPTLRGWGNPTDYDPIANPKLLPGLQYLNGNKVFFGNEQNYCTAESCPGGSPNPQAVANVYKNLLSAGLNINIVLPPLNMQNPNAAQMTTWQEFMNSFSQTCPECLSKASFAAINAYTLSTDPNNVDNWVQQVKDYYSYLSDKGFKGQLIVAEAGVNPGAYQNFDQRVQATINFAKELESRLATDSSLNSIIDKVTFFLMDDSTGKQFMVYRSCDSSGVCTWKVAEYLTYNQYIPGLLTPTPTQTLICSTSDKTPGYYRPAPCKNCGNPVELPVNSCAESFYSRQDTYFYLDPEDEAKSEVKMCRESDAYAYFERDWGGTVTIDTSKTAVPFAGYRDKLDNQEAKYLAQYFAGSLALRGPKNIPGTIEYDNEIQLESGVMAKILPVEELDNLRCKRIKNSGKENYQIPFKDNPNLPSPRMLSEFNTYENSTPCRRPTVKAEENPALWKQWDNEMVTWMQTDFAKLWPYIPLTTLKDAPGTLNMTIQHNPGTLSVIQAKLTFPHLASLYESSQELWSWLVPISETKNKDLIPQQANSQESDYLTNTNSETTKQLDEELAQSNSFCGLQQEVYAAELDDQTHSIILAQANPSPSPAPADSGTQTYKGITMQGFAELGSDGSSFNFKTNISNNDAYGFHIETLNYDIDGKSYSYRPGTYTPVDATLSLTNQDLGLSSISIKEGQTVTVNVYMVSKDADTSENPTQIFTIKGTFTLVNGKLITNWGKGIIPQKPATCGNDDSVTPGSCVFPDAMTDINPNDYICSNPYPLVTILDAKGYRVTLTQNQYDSFITYINQCINNCKGKDICDENSSHYDSRECGKCIENCKWVPLSKYSADLMNRKIGLDFQIPYLEKIGIYTTRGEGRQPMGIFDIFRPAELSQYEYKDAKSNIGYKYQGTKSSSKAPDDKESSAISNSRADPNSGYLYYPWLGGVEMAKQCVSKVLTQPNVGVDNVISSEYCPELIPQTNTNPYTPIPL